MIRSAQTRRGARLLKAFRRDSEGVTAVEFGLISPVLFMMLLGIFDMVHGVYTAAMINGAMQSAARNMTIEGAALREADVDARVTADVRAVVPTNSTITLQKLKYFDFNDVGRAEDFTDLNGDGQCNNGEPYVDVNGNNQWDSNRGAAGVGGARDVVLYTATVTYPRLFPIYRFIGLSQNARVQGSTVLRNQPFDEQSRVTTTRNCT